MAKKISQFEELQTLSGNEEIPVAFGGRNFKFKANLLKSLISKSDLGLDRVDNTPDLQKPISIAQASALNQKAPLSHTHTADKIDGLDTRIEEVAGNLNLGDVQVGKLEW